MADVSQSPLYQGVPAKTWLLNPRLVLSLPQANNDIVNSFDSNYPYAIPPSNGVGQETPAGQSNSQYGT
jgi:hypothetical protein